MVKTAKFPQQRAAMTGRPLLKKDRYPGPKNEKAYIAGFRFNKKLTI
jgi:hypothetical protein